MNKEYPVAIVVVVLFVLIIFVGCFFCFAPRHQVRAVLRSCRNCFGIKEEEEREMTNPAAATDATQL